MPSAIIPPVELPTIQLKSSVILFPVSSSIWISTSIWMRPLIPPPSRHKIRSPPWTWNASGVYPVCIGACWLWGAPRGRLAVSCAAGGLIVKKLGWKGVQMRKQFPSSPINIHTVIILIEEDKNASWCTKPTHSSHDLAVLKNASRCLLLWAGWVFC